MKNDKNNLLLEFNQEEKGRKSTGGKLPRFQKIKQNQLLVDIIQAIPDNKQIKLSDDNNTVAMVQYNNKFRRFELTVTDYNALSTKLTKSLYEEGKANQSVIKLLKAFMYRITEEQTDNHVVIIPLKEYQKLVGKSDIKDLRKRIKNDLEILKRYEITLETKGRNKDFLNVALFGGTCGIVKGNIIYRFNPDFFNLIKGIKQEIFDDSKILRINEHNHKHSLLLWEKIKDHKTKNLGKPNENIISVKTLYDYCITLPRYETLKDKGQWRQQIKTPFERDLFELNEFLETFAWEYKGNGDFNSWEEFCNANIELKFKKDLMKDLREKKDTAREKAKEEK